MTQRAGGHSKDRNRAERASTRRHCAQVMWARRRGGLREPENVWQHGSTAVVLSQSVAARCMHSAVDQDGTLGVAAGELGGPVR